MKKTQWKPFPYPEAVYQHTLAALKKHWGRLHQGDAEPWPADTGAQQAWRAYHAGEFAQAVELGLKSGAPSAVNAANKAAMIYANYLESDDEAKLAIFQQVAKRCEALQAQAPETPNAWYMHAYALGRYSQGISVAKALTQGLGGKIKELLEQALQLHPDHADTHIALGAWHAEVIDKVGSMVGGLTYGAKKEAGERHFKRALEINPDSAIARIEYANALAMMFGRSRLKEAEALYAQAAQCKAADAMERLDVESAKAELAAD